MSAEQRSMKLKSLNPKLMPFAAVLLVLLALLFMAAPLLGPARGIQRSGLAVSRGNGSTPPQAQFPVQGNGSQGQRYFVQGVGPQGQTFSNQGDSNFPFMRVVLGFSLLGGRNGPIIYFIALLLSLAAAVGLFLVKRWGQIFGVCMGVVYLLFALVALLPMLLFRFQGMRISMSLVMGFMQLCLALAVIIIPVIPARKTVPPVEIAPVVPNS